LLSLAAGIDAAVRGTLNCDASGGGRS
jgi:hypothetical protein